MFSAETIAAEIRAEEMQLRKAVADILKGRTRLRNQERLVAAMGQPCASSVGHRTKQEAERLAVLIRESLAEWERHRALIQQRLAYLRLRQQRELKS
ncbi:hypothetical protein [Bradyrhizobium sp. ORS 285]|nr:hypothetical protein [Bradyrhizobium sp. ORS 285]